MENGPFEDVFPIQNGDIPASYVSLPEGIRKPGLLNRGIFINDHDSLPQMVDDATFGFLVEPSLRPSLGLRS